MALVKVECFAGWVHGRVLPGERTVNRPFVCRGVAGFVGDGRPEVGGSAATADRKNSNKTDKVDTILLRDRPRAIAATLDVSTGCGRGI